MVFDHVGWGNNVHIYIQSFHMPLFFLVSGFLWSKGSNVRVVIRKRFQSVLIPYIFFSIIYAAMMIAAICLGIMEYFGKTDYSVRKILFAISLFPSDMTNMPIAPALWFLPCYFLCNVIFCIIEQLLSDKKWIAILSISIIGMIYSSKSDIMLPFTLEPLSAGILFMMIGELLHCKQVSLKRYLENTWLVLVLFVFEVAIAFLNGSVDMRSARYHNCFLYLLNGVLGTFAWYGIIRKVSCYLPTRIIQGLVYLSINSISYVCLNQFFIKLGKIIYITSPDGSFVIVFLKKILMLIFVLLSCSLLNELIKRSKLSFMIGRQR